MVYASEQTTLHVGGRLKTYLSAARGMSLRHGEVLVRTKLNFGKAKTAVGSHVASTGVSNHLAIVY